MKYVIIALTPLSTGCYEHLRNMVTEKAFGSILHHRQNFTWIIIFRGRLIFINYTYTYISWACKLIPWNLIVFFTHSANWRNVIQWCPDQWFLLKVSSKWTGLFNETNLHWKMPQVVLIARVDLISGDLYIRTLL